MAEIIAGIVLETGQMHKAVCDECGQNCEVPFRPSGDKPIYCSNCFENKGGGSKGSSRRSSGSSNYGKQDNTNKQLLDQVTSLNKKLDRILTVIESSSTKKEKPEQKKTEKKVVKKAIKVEPKVEEKEVKIAVKKATPKEEKKPKTKSKKASKKATSKDKIVFTIPLFILLLKKRECIYTLSF